MGGITTYLVERVESLLPRATVAACVPSSPFCENIRVNGGGGCFAYFHKNCHFSCHGAVICGAEGNCDCGGLCECCGTGCPAG